MKEGDVILLLIGDPLGWNDSIPGGEKPGFAEMLIFR
jgi:hypothetical protein